MKKSVILAALGLTVGAVSSFGQGAIGFSSYFADGGSGTTLINFGANGSGFSGKVGTGTSTGLFSADVVWSLTPIVDSAGNGALLGGWSSSTTAPSVNNMLTTIANGYISPASNFSDSTYTGSGLVYFEVFGYLTSDGSYANSSIRGHSAAFSAPLATGINGPALSPLYGSWTVSAVPEPTTLALAGLGGLAALVGFRRKNV